MLTSAVLLVAAPQRLAREISGRRVTWPRRTAGIVALMFIGCIVVVLTPVPGLAHRTALALAAECAAALAFVDFRLLVIPDLYVAALALLAVLGPLAKALPEAIMGAALGGGLLWGVAWLWRRRSGVDGLGLGDVKLTAALGALLGPQRVAEVICVSALFGAMIALTLRPRTADGTTVAPLGACLALTGVAALGWSFLP